MQSKHLHSPVSTRALCPVCKKAVYSRGGIHPQCALAVADREFSTKHAVAVASLPERVAGATAPVVVPEVSP